MYVCSTRESSSIAERAYRKAFFNYIHFFVFLFLLDFSSLSVDVLMFVFFVWIFFIILLSAHRTFVYAIRHIVLVIIHNKIYNFPFILHWPYAMDRLHSRRVLHKTTHAHSINTVRNLNNFSSQTADMYAALRIRCMLYIMLNFTNSFCEWNVNAKYFFFYIFFTDCRLS